MTFSSLEFVFGFVPLFFVAYHAISNLRWRNAILLLASLGFYAWGEPVFVVLMLVSIAVNYGIGLAMAASPRPGARRAWLIAGVSANVGVLFAFKYTNFALLSLAALFSFRAPALDLPLPIGISFYTFMALAYLIDLYRGEYVVERNPARLALGIAAFPVVTAGPIARYKTIGGQLDSRSVDVDAIAGGLRRFAIGMGKKVLIANNLAYVAGQIFGLAPAQYGALGAWVGAIGWTLQIYFDFSGYSDMAIGLGAMLGIRYPENFDFPYVARSASDFWRRWHMSLSSFFRDYVYIPLGGNRVPKWRWVLNMAAVWALTGLWHGANWTFVAWGLYYGVILVLERFAYPKFVKEGPRALQHLYLMTVVVVGWILFMSPTIGQAGSVMAAMVGTHGPGNIPTLVMLRVLQPAYILVFAAAILGSVPWHRPLRARFEKSTWMGLVVDASLVLMIALSMIMTVLKTFNPFIYARF